MPIHILPPEIASQIAAGEVVERPASVVKELVENALDAEAKSIAVRVEGAGKQTIEVSDDGSGIPSIEMALAVERHATSKLREAADLMHITTLGFRGEALASIGAVSRMTIVSRHADEAVGTSLRVEAGKNARLEPVGSPVGTLVRVEDLFFNVPARLKFLKHDTTERNQIDQVAMRYSLAYPRVRFTLSHGDRLTLQTAGSGDRREVLAVFWGAEIAGQMLAVHFEEESTRISGFISPTSITKSNRRDMIFFVNGRPVQEPALSAAVLKGYQTYLMVGRFPMVVLFLDIPPDTVDVNVHPAKAEVRFRESGRIFSLVQHAVRRAILAHSPVPGIESQLFWGDAGRRSDRSWDWRQETGALPAPDAAIPAFEPASPPASAQPGLPGDRVPLLRLVGQVANTYLVAEGPDGLYLVDQHAAHERVLFERFMDQRQGAIPAQTLLQPTSVELSPTASRLLEDQLPVLHGLGFQVEAFGTNTFLVRAIPALLKNLDPAAALRVLVEDFEEDERPLQEEKDARLIARICKRAAVKAGLALSVEEQRSLLEDLEACRSPRTCPHGRPTMIHLPVDLLERQFGRRGAR